MTRKEAKKLVLLPVPAGHKMKYRHFYKARDGRHIYKDSEGVWRYCVEKLFDTGEEPYNGNVRKLVATGAWLEKDDDPGYPVATGASAVNPKDTPVKKLGTAIAHNRCIKEFRKNALTLAQVELASVSDYESF